MAVGDRYKLVDRQSYLGQEMLNRYYFVHEVGTGDAQAISDLFQTQILPSIVALQDASCNHFQIDVINLDDPTDFVYDAMSENGTQGGDGLASFYALNYTLYNNNRTFRPGSKRFGGIAEGVVVNNAIDATAQAAVDALAAKLKGVISDGVGNSVRHNLLRVAPGDIVTGSAAIVDAAFTAVSTQRSRKA